jgi:SAM-dependent methyltransferase
MRPIITSTVPPSGFTIGGVADPCFEVPRLAALYDPLDPDRADLLAYLGMAGEFCARSVLDIGCGTGTLACVLATLGLEVTGLDPAAASLDIARAKPGGDRVRWVHGDVTALPPLQVDLAVMAGNVAQVFLGDEEWQQVLAAAHAALRPGGRLVFETRDPARRAWEDWDRAHTYGEHDVPGAGTVTDWLEVTQVSGDLVTFRWTVRFAADGTELTSDSTLRFRSREEIAESLRAAGFEVDEVRGAPDRPGREFVFVARRTGGGRVG